MHKTNLRIRIMLIVIITIACLLAMFFLRLIPASDHYTREGWVGDDSHFGMPGESVNFTYLVEAYGGEHNYEIELKDLSTELENVIVTDDDVPLPRNVQFTEGDIFAVMISGTVPDNATEGTILVTAFLMIVKLDGGSKWESTEEVRVSVTQSPDLHNRPTREGVGDEEVRYDGSSTGGPLEIWKFAGLLLIIVALQIFTLFIFPLFIDRNEFEPPNFPRQP